MTDTTAAINAVNLGCSLTYEDLGASISVLTRGDRPPSRTPSRRTARVWPRFSPRDDCRVVVSQDNGKLGRNRMKRQGFTC